MVAVEFLEFRIPFFRQSKRDLKTRIIFFLLTLVIFSAQLHKESTIYCFGNSFKKVFSYRLFFWGQKNFRNGSVWWFQLLLCQNLLYPKKIFCPPSTIHCEHFVVLKAAILGSILKIFLHFLEAVHLRFLTPHSPLSPILLNRLKGLMSPFGRSPLSPKQVMSFMLFLDEN